MDFNQPLEKLSLSLVKLVIGPAFNQPINPLKTAKRPLVQIWLCTLYGRYGQIFGLETFQILKNCQYVRFFVRPSCRLQRVNGDEIMSWDGQGIERKEEKMLPWNRHGIEWARNVALGLAWDREWNVALGLAWDKEWVRKNVIKRSEKKNEKKKK